MSYELLKLSDEVHSLAKVDLPMSFSAEPWIIARYFHLEGTKVPLFQIVQLGHIDPDCKNLCPAVLWGLDGSCLRGE